MRQRTSFHRLAQEGGQTLVEFALTVMILLTLVFGLIEFSRAIYAASVIQWAAQHGARIGVEHYPDMSEMALKAQIETAVRSRMTGLNQGAAEIHVDLPAPEIVQVDVSYPFEFVVTWFGEGITLHASASMVAH